MQTLTWPIPAILKPDRGEARAISATPPPHPPEARLLCGVCVTAFITALQLHPTLGAVLVTSSPESWGQQDNSKHPIKMFTAIHIDTAVFYSQPINNTYTVDVFVFAYVLFALFYYTFVAGVLRLCKHVFHLLARY